jgi:NAD(P)-dependent dehydrogenase (short-subunit alcohol dehydrogenase family)
VRIDGISAIVTGGASGLGLATARELTSRGASVTIVDLPESAGPAVAKELGDRAQFAAADITDAEQVQAAVDAAAAFGPLRALVHCAGRGGDRTRIIDREHKPGSLETFNQVLQVNLVGTYNVLRLAAAAMSYNEVVDGDRGACVLTASVAAFDGQIGQTSYTASPPTTWRAGRFGSTRSRRGRSTPPCWPACGRISARDWRPRCRTRSDWACPPTTAIWRSA